MPALKPLRNYSFSNNSCFEHNVEIKSTKYTVLLKSCFGFIFKNFKMLISGVCFLFYFLTLSGVNGFV